MTNRELAEALRLCGSTPETSECHAKCPFFKGPLKECIPKMTSACADALANSETHILALQQEIRKLRGQLEIERKPQWVSVKERLPESAGHSVLVVVSGFCENTNGGYAIAFHDAIEIATYYRDGEQWFVEAYPYWENPNVTYWQPLPEPPSTEEVK